MGTPNVVIRNSEYSRLNERLAILETKMNDLQENKIVTEERVRELEKVIWKAMGMIGVLVVISEIAIKLIVK